MNREAARTFARRTAKKAARLYTVPTTPMRRLPDFLIIGTQRGGTTSLYRYLEKHPSVLPTVLNKGVHYFDTNFEKGPVWYRSHFPTTAAKGLRRRRAGGGPVITGEGSPYYSFHPLAPQRIAELLPNGRFILMLRDPISRAHSHYQHEVARGFEELSFEEALEREEERLAGEEERMIADPSYFSFAHQHHSYVARGLYLSQIQRWHSVLPREQLLIVDSTDFFSNADATYREVLRFLELAERSLPAYEKMNAHSYDRMTPRALAFLRSRVADPNRALSGYLERAFPWDVERG
ncbi:MAG: sulfotransferase domain-containing protein [Actinomycetota bacterium]